MKFVIYRKATSDELGEVLTRVSAVDIPDTTAPTKQASDAYRKYKQGAGEIAAGEYTAVPAATAQRFRERETRSTATDNLGEVE